MRCPQSHKPKWRNWQTRMVQVHVPARVWGFESLLRHQASRSLATLGISSLRARASLTYIDLRSLRPFPQMLGSLLVGVQAGTVLLFHLFDGKNFASKSG